MRASGGVALVRRAGAVGITLHALLTTSSCTGLEPAGDRIELEASGGGGRDDGSPGQGGGVTGGGDGMQAGQPGAGGAAAGAASVAAGASGCPPREQRHEVRLPVEAGADLEIGDEVGWSCSNDYILQGRVLVTEGGRVKIDPGTHIRAEGGALLLVERGGQLDALGTLTEPIVFTSARPEGQRAAGDWRGVVLTGKAPTHTNNRFVYNTTDDYHAYYGGGKAGDPTHRCGELRYVRIEFAGGNLDEDGTPGAALTLAGCGSTTLVDHVQVHRATDGIGLLGGSAALRHVIVSGNARGDCIEWTDGYSGTIQFAIAQSLGAGAGMVGSNSETAPAADPVSSPTVYNATLVGSPPLVSGSHFGFLLRFGSRATFKNSIVTGFADAAFDLRFAPSWLATKVGSGQAIDISHGLLHGNARNYTDEAAILDDLGSMREDDPGLDAATSAETPRFSPDRPSVTIQVEAVPQPFDTTAAYRGAVAPNGRDWTQGWTAYPKN